MFSVSSWFRSSSGGETTLDQAALLLGERGDERRRDATGGMPWSALQQRGLFASDRRLLKPGQDCVGPHGLLGEEVSRPEEDPDPNPPLSQRRGQGGDHRRGKTVVNAPSEQDVKLRRLGVCGEGFEQHLDHALPQHKARPGPDVAATLASLKDELARSVLDEHPQEPGRGDVEIGRHPL